MKYKPHTFQVRKKPTLTADEFNLILNFLSEDNFHETHPFAILQVSGDAKRYESGDEDNYSQVGFESFVTHST